MRRFAFRLAPLLRLRSQLERTARRELARRTVALQAIDQQLDAAIEGRREFAAAAASGGATGELARALEAGLGRREFELQGRRQRALSALEAARTDYLARAKDLGTLEKLEDKRRETWRAQVQREEQEELDELARLAREAGRVAEAARGED